jgi:oxygen-independent coproporphyrinogen-3 oxidase
VRGWIRKYHMSDVAPALVLAERAVPRYTSYPTAPHFQPEPPGRAAQWYGELAEDTHLSLYLHVPYCRAICNYCGCNTKAVQREEPLDAFTATLAAEIDLLAISTPARAVTHIHWGGGTPSLLGPERLLRLHEGLRSRFDLSVLREHAIELDPRTVTPALAQGLAAIGIDRVSLGAQDFNAHVERAIGRIQPFEIVERAASLLREVGIAAINIDLMYGLPEQSVEDVRRSAHLAAQLAPSRLAIFGYAHVPLFKVHQKLIDASTLPGAAERMIQEQAARDVLVAEGYEVIGLDHFALPGDPLAKAARTHTLHRNFQGYTVDAADALLPLGPSSIGRVPQGYVQNAPDVAGWRRAVDAGTLPVVKSLAFGDGDVLRAAVIERLMCDFEVNYGEIALHHGVRVGALDDAAEALDELARDGVVVREGRYVRVTRAGRPFVRLAAAAFDAYLDRSAARHSVAV